MAMISFSRSPGLLSDIVPSLGTVILNTKASSKGKDRKGMERGKRDQAMGRS